ncbi:TonB-dependent receptor [bacterium]|nr:TonB-dependent receptor [bacterium]
MNRYITSILIITLLVIFQGFATAQVVWTISGKVIDAQNKEAIPFATVAVYDTTNSTLITGGATLADGTFSITANSRTIEVHISFIGYNTQVIKTFTTNGRKLDIGTVEMVQSAQGLDEVVVTSEKSSVELKLDKRVFNVGQDIGSTGMGALDVLNNVPSVNVDIAGNITLRGNSGVLILIDGKPTASSDDPSKVLASITADMIERIEVITNPSAKYEAEGSSGIINIVLKKNEKKGLNGSISANTGWPHNHSIGVSLNNRSEKFNLFTQLGTGYRSIPDYNSSVNRSLLTNREVQSKGVDYRNENFYNITLGSDYYINKLNVLTVSGNFAYELENQPSHSKFSVYDENKQLISQYERLRTATATNPKYRYDVKYNKEFKNNEDHKLLISTQGNFFGKNLVSNFANTSLDGSAVSPAQKTATDFYQQEFTYKLDYTNPISKKITIETGAMYEINNVGNDYSVYNTVEQDLVKDQGLSNNFKYIQKVLGVYGTGAYESNQWGLKLGLRYENTLLHTTLANTGEENEQRYGNFFPSIHSSYKFSKQFSIQAGYSRRISRPRLWDLNPYINIQNTYNVSTGNPNLRPEYGDSYELTGVFFFNKISFNSSLYYLRTTNVMDRVATFSKNLTITMPMNIGVRDKVGFEFNGKYVPNKWLTFTGDANLGKFWRNGEYQDKVFDFSSNQWSSRLTSKFKLPANIDFELTSNYQSSYKTIQGTVSGYPYFDSGIRKKIKNGKMVVNFSVRDIFASRIRESVATQNNNYLYSFSKRGRFFTLNFNYSIGKGEAMTYSGGGHH